MTSGYQEYDVLSSGDGVGGGEDGVGEVGDGFLFGIFDF